MKTVLITGSGGLIGSEAAHFFLGKKCKVVGIDNNKRMFFFGPQGDVSSNIAALCKRSGYIHYFTDICDVSAIDSIVSFTLPDVVIHCAAQPSHDRAAQIPREDFNTNAVGTLNMLESVRKNVPGAVFIFMSTNKVYGDAPNRLELEELETRFDYVPGSRYHVGIDESLSIDNCLHSVFGASKVSADVMSQEYGRYFGMNIGIFRGGCLTGTAHAAVELHGFLSYIVKCAVNEKPYVVYGYSGKQVRDQIYCSDVISAFEKFIENPHPGEVYNLGGCRQNSASVVEVIKKLEMKLGRQFVYSYSDQNRRGDHVCYITDMTKFKSHYPTWSLTMSLDDMLDQMILHEKISNC